MARSVTVQAPATSANMGPGFDCLGMALDIWNTVRVDTEATGFEIHGLGRDELPTGPENLVARSFRLACEEAGQPAPSVRFTCTNEIPLGRGLGSSSAAAVAGIVAANELLGRPLDDAGMLALAARRSRDTRTTPPPRSTGGARSSSTTVTASSRRPSPYRSG